MSRGIERVQLQPAYILHQRPFRDSSRILDIFSRQFGRVTLVAKGVRRAGSRQRAFLQPFQPLAVSWSLRSEMGTLTGAEPGGMISGLKGDSLLSAFYVNELLLRLLGTHDPHPEIFDEYGRVLGELENSETDIARPLRIFEKRLLEALGYGLVLDAVADSGAALDPASYYVYLPEQGLFPATGAGETGAIPGRSLLALAAEKLDDPESLRDARRLLRTVLDLYLGPRPMRTREVLKSLHERSRQ